MDVIVWGAGEEYKKNKYMLANRRYRLIDNAVEKQGMFIDGIKVEDPDIIKKSRYDCIVISTTKYFHEIYNLLIHQYLVADGKIISIRDADKELLMREIGKYKVHKCSGPRILFGYCFLIYENCRLHDFLLAESLRLRGAEIVPVICGATQEFQCSVFGGVWGNDTHDVKEKNDRHNKNCLMCTKYDKKVWEQWGGYKITSASDFLTEEDRRSTEKFIQKLDIHTIHNWTYEDFPIGEWALKTYYNNELISYKTDWKPYEENEIRSLASNVMNMCIASLKIINEVNPDIVYSNDSFYYPYSVLERIARNKHIPFYNAYGIRKNTYSYAKNVPVVSMDLNSAWKKFSLRELRNEESRFIQEYVSNRRYGRDMQINTADPFKTVAKIKDDSIHGTIDKNKKTALIATNVTWDAAALNKGIVFENIVDWVLYTIRLFSENKEWQLIVRTHPAEISKMVPEARERICTIVMEKYNNTLPSNIILIDGDAPISIYDLFPQVDLGIVYTSTVGLEMCCLGIPTVTVAEAPYREKGFTFDPVDEIEYKKQVEKLMEKAISDKERNAMKYQAQKFFLLYYFIYMLPNTFYKFEYEGNAQLTFHDPEELQAGKNLIWDYICDSILAKKAILSEDRLPPYKLEV